VIALHALRVRHMLPRAALRLACFGGTRRAVARKVRTISPLALTFRRWGYSAASSPPPVMRTVDGQLLVLSPRLSLTLALSQAHAGLIVSPKSAARQFPGLDHSFHWERPAAAPMHERIFSERWFTWRQPAGQGHDGWRGSQGAISTGVVGLSSAHEGDRYSFQARLRGLYPAVMSTHSSAWHVADSGTANRATEGPAFGFGIRSIAGTRVVVPDGLPPTAFRRPAVAAGLPLIGRRGFNRRAADFPAIGPGGRTRLVPPMLRTAVRPTQRVLQTVAVKSEPGSRAHNSIIWQERAHRMYGRPASGQHISDQRHATRAVSTVALAYRASNSKAPTETIAPPPVTSERATAPAIDMYRLERDLWRQMERRVRIERERRGRQ
jgi:hypothetical protein